MSDQITPIYSLKVCFRFLFSPIIHYKMVKLRNVRWIVFVLFPYTDHVKLSISCFCLLYALSPSPPPPLYPPGLVCWWGLLKRTPPSRASWRLEPSITVPGQDSPIAAHRFPLIIPVSHLMHFQTFYFFRITTGKTLTDFE